MQIHEAIAAVNAGKATGFKTKGMNTHMRLRDGFIVWADGKCISGSFLAESSFHTRTDFVLVGEIPEGWVKNNKGDLVKPSITDRWINVYADPEGGIFEKDFRSKEAADAQKNAACGTRFLRQLHSSVQYTLRYDEVFGKQ